MDQEKESQIKNELVRQLVGGVSFSEIVKILHELATKEVESKLSQSTDEEKEQVYKDLIESKQQ
jgi:hypothetical protein